MKRSRREDEVIAPEKRPRSILSPSPLTRKLINFKAPDDNSSVHPELNEDFEVSAGDFCVGIALLLDSIFLKIHSDGFRVGKPPSSADLLTLLVPLVLASDMEFSCGVVTLIYFLRAYARHLRQETAAPFLTEENWRSIIVASSLLANKLFDDLCMSNKDFADIFAKESLTLSLINSFELTMLRLLNFDLSISDLEYRTTSELLVFELEGVQRTKARLQSTDSKELTLVESPLSEPLPTKDRPPEEAKAPSSQGNPPQGASVSPRASEVDSVSGKSWWDVPSPLSWVWHTGALKE
jgi:hypothetical protein